MKRRTISLFIILFIVFSGMALDYDRKVFTKADAITLRATGIHSIVAPLSSQDFRPKRYRTTKRYYKKRYTRYSRYSRPSLPPMLPTSLYRVEKSSNGYTLYLKKMSGMGSALLISEPTYNYRSRQWKAYALRSRNAIKQNSSFHVAYKNRLLGKANGLFFLGSALSKSDPKLGNAFRLFIPSKAIYGYWQQRINEIKIEKGSILRVRFYTTRYGGPGRRGRTYLLMINK